MTCRHILIFKNNGFVAKSPNNKKGETMNEETMQKFMNDISGQLSEMQKFMFEIADRLNKEHPIMGSGVAYKVVEKVDMLNDSIQKLLVLEERQFNFTNRLDQIEHHTDDINKKVNDFEIKIDRLHTLESRYDQIEKDLNGLGQKVEKYINIGRGVMIIITAAFALMSVIFKFYGN
jgi:hypothetical protein